MSSSPTPRSILVTGASRGLGRALAEQAAASGARVVLVARGAPALHSVVEQIRARGGEAWALVADVGDKTAVHRIAHEAAALAGPIDVLIHCASTLGPTPLPLLLDTECEDLERVLQVNLVGPFRLTKIVAGAMALRGHGTIVSVSSDAALHAYETWGSYGLSKAALDHLTRTYAAELAVTGVRLFSVDPGEMDTQMHRDAIPDADPATLADPGDVARRILAMVDDERRAPSGARVIAGELQVQP